MGPRRAGGPLVGRLRWRLREFAASGGCASCLGGCHRPGARAALAATPPSSEMEAVEGERGARRRWRRARQRDGRMARRRARRGARRRRWWQWQRRKALQCARRPARCSVRGVCLHIAAQLTRNSKKPSAHEGPRRARQLQVFASARAADGERGFERASSVGERHWRSRDQRGGERSSTPGDSLSITGGSAAPFSRW